MSNCVFCDICSNQIDAKIVYNDNNVTCFLPRKMEVYGHLLVVPNKHYENIFDISEIELNKIFSFVKVLSQDLKDKLGATGINILHASGSDAGQSVGHFHIHIFPRFEGDKIDAWPKIDKKEFNVDEVYRKLIQI